MTLSSPVDPHPDDHPAGPFVELSRSAWAALADQNGIGLDQPTLERLRGLDDPTNLSDIEDVYLPLTAVLNLYREHTGTLYRASHEFLQLSERQTPFVIGVAGSVAVGKSTTARLLAELLSRSDDRPRVDLVTTDGFLYPNAELSRRKLLGRKGFPESYDRRALQKFVVDVKSGLARVTAPVYSHVIYDIVPDEQIVVDNPDILIIEGLNVLAPARQHADGSTSLAVSDFFDFSVYVDADDHDIRQWYIHRFLRLRETAFHDPSSYFAQYATLSDEQARELAIEVWDAINGPNLAINIRPTRGRATAILRKGADHGVESVRIRKI